MEKSAFDWIALCLGIAGFFLAVFNTVWNWRRHHVRLRIIAETFTKEGDAVTLRVYVLNNGIYPVFITGVGLIRHSILQRLPFRHSETKQSIQPGTRGHTFIDNVPAGVNSEALHRRLQFYAVTGDGTVAYGDYLSKFDVGSAR